MPSRTKLNQHYFNAAKRGVRLQLQVVRYTKIASDCTILCLSFTHFQEINIHAHCAVLCVEKRIPPYNAVRCTCKQNENFKVHRLTQSLPFSSPSYIASCDLILICKKSAIDSVACNFLGNSSNLVFTGAGWSFVSQGRQPSSAVALTAIRHRRWSGRRASGAR